MESSKSNNNPKSWRLTIEKKVMSMDFIEKKELEYLIDHNADLCISIFSPTHRAGREMQREDKIHFKNQVQSVGHKLEEIEISPRKRKDLLTDCYELLDDSHFWSHNSDGVAVFISDGKTHIYQLPVHFEGMNYIDEEFYLKPLIPLFSENKKYFLLELGLKEPKFYECDKYSLEEIEVDDLLPQRLEDVVGYDYEESMLQFAAQNQKRSGSTASFHGHADDRSSKKVEIKKFFNEIDKGIQKLISGSNQPLILACIDYMFPIYQEVNNYPYLLDEFISGSSNSEDIIDLHHKAQTIMDKLAEKSIAKRKETFKVLLSSAKASNQLVDILPAGIEGKIDSLFVENKMDVFGTYQPENATITRDNDHQIGENKSLMNWLVKKALQTGSELYLLESEDMPNQASEVAAIFRYE